MIAFITLCMVVLLSLIHIYKTGRAFLHQKTGSEKDEPEINTSDGQMQCQRRI